MKGFGELSTPKERVLLYVREVVVIVSPDNDDAIKDCLQSKEGKIEFHGVKLLVGCEDLCHQFVCIFWATQRSVEGLNCTEEPQIEDSAVRAVNWLSGKHDIPLFLGEMAMVPLLKISFQCISNGAPRYVGPLRIL